MPEYKRFIAYFYEYIDGRKQKNAGFAKVELRNGMWRIMFRIRTDQMPEAPVQVFGFVRERGYLLGFLLGNMNSGYEISEEWAYGAEKEIGHKKYRFGNLSGVWIQSEDGRKFITVWDDDPIDVQKFVLKIPESLETNAENRTEKDEEIEEDISKSASEKYSGQKEVLLEEDVMVKIPEESEDQNDEEKMKQSEDENREEKAEESENENSEKIMEQSIEAVCEEEPWIRELFCRRKHVQPFADGQLHDCIQILPCDLMRFQQKGWQTGRSSFLQHGFYQYHHLLLGKNADGEYILGVPGIWSSQEQYMSQLFGYDKFLRSKVYACGRIFGYWCRKLREPEYWKSGTYQERPRTGSVISKDAFSVQVPSDGARST